MIRSCWYGGPQRFTEMTYAPDFRRPRADQEYYTWNTLTVCAKGEEVISAKPATWQETENSGNPGQPFKRRRACRSLATLCIPVTADIYIACGGGEGSRNFTMLWYHGPAGHP